MGGSGGDDGSKGHASGEEAKSCNLKIDTAIYSPVPEVADNLETGDILSVQLTGTKVVKVGVFTQDGECAGTIARAEKLEQLISCLQNDNEFLAEVTSANGSDIRIQVRTA